LFAATATLFWWAYVGLSYLWWGTHVTPSHSVLGVGYRLLDHQYWLVWWGIVGLLGSLLRVLFWIPGEFTLFD